MKRPEEKDYGPTEGWIFANHLEAYYRDRVADSELSLRVYDAAGVSEYWLRHPEAIQQ